MLLFHRNLNPHWPSTLYPFFAIFKDFLLEDWHPRLEAVNSVLTGSKRFGTMGAGHHHDDAALPYFHPPDAMYHSQMVGRPAALDLGSDSRHLLESHLG